MSTKPHTLTRRQVLAHGATAAGLSLVGGCPTGGSGAPGERPRPNVLLITADDLGWRDLSVYGDENVHTPHLDRLAGEGVRFDRAFDVASSCSSSRAAFITGQYPHTNGVIGLTHVHTDFQLAYGHTTLPGLLYEAGYLTALEGKWHVATFQPVSDYGYAAFLNRTPLPTFVIPDAQSSTDFLRSYHSVYGSERFYLELNFMQTHRDLFGQFEMAPGYEVDPDAISIPAYWNLPDVPELRAELARYYSQVRLMDAIIGEILAVLDEEGLADNTLVAFVSDNGPPFPGNKMTLYDRGTGTPMMLRWPGVIPAGRREDALVSTIDLMPTILEACGIAVPDTLQGHSLMGLCTGHPDAMPRGALFSEMTYHKDYIPMRAVRTERFKYVRNLNDAPIGLDDLEGVPWAEALVTRDDQPWTRPRVPEELYDLDEDPNERDNLVADSAYESVLDEMRTRLEDQMAANSDPLQGVAFEVTTG